MRTDGILTSAQVGKFMIARATNYQAVVVKIISVFEDLVGWSMMDPNIPMRSAKVRFKKENIYSYYDTLEEANKVVEDLPDVEVVKPKKEKT